MVQLAHDSCIIISGDGDLQLGGGDVLGKEEIPGV